MLTGTSPADQTTHEMTEHQRLLCMRLAAVVRATSIALDGTSVFDNLY
jgi:hypothetical protein